VNAERKGICMVGRNFDSELGLGEDADTIVKAYQCGVGIFEFDVEPVAAESVAVTTYENVAAEVEVAATLQLQAHVLPATVNQDVTWTVVSGSELASVNASGIVTGIAPGTVIVRATTVADTLIYGEIEVEVKEVVASNEQFEKERVNIYPNPTTGSIVLDVDSPISSIALYDIAGKRVAYFTTASFDISHLNAGIYQTKIQFENGNQAFVKIVKK